MAKWRKRTTTADAPMGPKPASTVLTAEDEAIAVAFRQHPLRPLDDCLYAWQETIPHLSRSALHRWLKHHGVSHLPLSENGQSTPKKKFKDYPMGYLPVDFLRRVLEKLPYKVHTVLTDNGVQFTPQPHQLLLGGHSFDRICRKYGVEHRLTNPAHPWTNGQVERFNRPLKEATVQRYHYESTPQLNEHLQVFLLAYNHAKRLKRLRGLTPHEFVCAQWQKNPTIFIRDPTQLTPGLYS